MTMLDYQGQTWKVELRAIPKTDGVGTLEFSFVQAGVGDDEVRLTWTVASHALQALSKEGVDMSEELLREQLELALAEGRTVDANGVDA